LNAREKAASDSYPTCAADSYPTCVAIRTRGSLEFLNFWPATYNPQSTRWCIGATPITRVHLSAKPERDNPASRAKSSTLHA